MGNISNISLNLLLEEVYLRGKLNSLNKIIINEGFDIKTNPVLKEIISQLKGNFNFIMTYGVGISGFIGPVKSLLENKNLNVTDYDVALLTIVAIYIILSKPKEEIDEVVDKVKERGLEKEITPVLNFISKTINLFKIFGKKFGYAINSLLDILSFTFLSVPVLDLIKNVVLEKGFSINNFQELLTGIVLAVSTHSLKKLINKDKLQENITSEGKFDFLKKESLIGLEYYNTEEFMESGIVYRVWDQDDKFVDIEWEDPEEMSEDNEPMTEYSTVSIDRLIEDLNKGFYVIKTFEGFNLPNVYDTISGLFENKENMFQNPEDYIGSIFYYTNKPNEEYKIEDLRVEYGYDDFIISWEDSVNGIKHKIGYYVIDFLTSLKEGRIKLKKIGAYQKEVEDIINNLYESDNFDWFQGIKQFSPAEEFLYEIMSNLTMVPSENYPGWMLYKDKNGKILMVDDINTGTKEPELYLNYNKIWLKLKDNYGLNYKEAMDLCVRMLEMVHKRKVLTSDWPSPWNLYLL